jgi:hypothetical protein
MTWIYFSMKSCEFGLFFHEKSFVQIEIMLFKSKLGGEILPPIALFWIMGNLIT